MSGLHNETDDFNKYQVPPPRAPGKSNLIVLVTTCGLWLNGVMGAVRWYRHISRKKRETGSNGGGSEMNTACKGA
jgi:hypothetical protein